MATATVKQASPAVSACPLVDAEEAGDGYQTERSAYWQLTQARAAAADGAAAQAAVVALAMRSALVGRHDSCEYRLGLDGKTAGADLRLGSTSGRR